MEGNDAASTAAAPDRGIYWGFGKVGAGTGRRVVPGRTNRGSFQHTPFCAIL